MLLKKEFDHATSVDTSDLAAKNDFIAFKSEVECFTTSLYNLKTKVDDLDVGKLKTVPIDLKKLNDVVDIGYNYFN